MVSLQEFNYFFELPGELREQILGYLVVEPGGIIVGQRGEWSRSIAYELGQPQDSERRRHRGVDSSLCSDDSYSDEEDDYGDQFTKKPRWPLNYFLVSHTFHREATCVYFQENTFYLLATGRKIVSRQPACGHHVVRSATWMLGRPRRFTGEGSEVGDDARFPGPCERLLGDPRYRDSRRRMKNIVIYIKALRGILVEGVFRPLGDMYVPSFCPCHTSFFLFTGAFIIVMSLLLSLTNDVFAQGPRRRVETPRDKSLVVSSQGLRNAVIRAHASHVSSPQRPRPRERETQGRRGAS